MNERPILLLVDDETSVHQALRRVFRSEPYEIRTAETAMDGLKVFDTGVPIRAVISDYRMPGMNGVDFLKEVFARSPETLRIVLSGFADRPILLDAVQSGRIYRYLPKPWDDELLKATVRKGIEHTAPAWEKREQIQTLLTEKSHLQQRVGAPASGVADRAEFVQRMAKMMTASQEGLDTPAPGILCVGSDGIILICNDTAATCLKTTPQQLIGSATSEVLSDGLNGFIHELLTSEKLGSLYYQEGGTSMRGMRLTYANDDCSALIFI